MDYTKEQLTEARLAEIFLELQAKGAKNINLVTATQWLPWVLPAGVLLPLQPARPAAIRPSPPRPASMLRRLMLISFRLDMIFSFSCSTSHRAGRCAFPT